MQRLRMQNMKRDLNNTVEDKKVLMGGRREKGEGKSVYCQDRI